MSVSKIVVLSSASATATLKCCSVHDEMRRPLPTTCDRRIGSTVAV